MDRVSWSQLNRPPSSSSFYCLPFYRRLPPCWSTLTVIRNGFSKKSKSGDLLFLVFVLVASNRHFIADRKAARCCCIRGRKCATVATAIAGRSARMARRREKITWNSKCKGPRWDATFFQSFRVSISSSISQSIRCKLFNPRHIFGR